ncbi:MupG family TIM beta-alpha barrel fold protein [Clostridium sp. SHJSY1]|uniref:DUF871 domain-containing protein n=1 Tax=Clostridium sp. SHJSY1 TaxID=2942483 RepID=UPI0028757CB7|nr:MupG family TIM beta-alpha barrel fold protein [Clostridium sp. SHJSY1]MDS0526336.1 MupG family TIM beta-alpha barrel fold protein [Clostridium sp. SHJSY1]
MRKLGISIYPIHNSIEEIKNYIDLAGKYNFKRVFTCLLSVDGDREKIMQEFREIIEYANNYGMEVIADISPKVFEELKISYQDLSEFKKIGLYGIRLDEGFSGNEEAIMTFNKENLKIEFNMSNGTKYIDNIMSYKPNAENILGCHNFYPHRYTGLGYDHFIKTSKQYKELGVRTAAFVTSNTGKYGPWPVSEGLCTLEMHREMNIVSQVKHLWATDLIDDVIVANCFASETELKELSEIDPYCITLKCELNNNIPEIERKIVLEEFHFNRGDVSDYVIRSTQSRVKYKGHDFKVFNPVDIKKGDIIIDSSLYEHYAGEMQIARLDMKNSGKTNVVGNIINDEVFLLNYIEPWQKFKLIEK